MRTTNVPASKARRKKRLKAAKGFQGRNKNLNRVTSGVVRRSLANQYTGRKLRKRDMRSLWITRIGIAARLNDLTYAGMIGGLTRSGVIINRKILAELAVRDPAAFSALAGIAKNAL